MNSLASDLVGDWRQQPGGKAEFDAEPLRRVLRLAKEAGLHAADALARGRVIEGDRSPEGSNDWNAGARRPPSPGAPGAGRNGRAGTPVLPGGRTLRPRRPADAGRAGHARRPADEDTANLLHARREGHRAPGIAARRALLRHRHRGQRARAPPRPPARPAPRSGGTPTRPANSPTSAATWRASGSGAPAQTGKATGSISRAGAAAARSKIWTATRTRTTTSPTPTWTGPFPPSNGSASARASMTPATSTPSSPLIAAHRGSRGPRPRRRRKVPGRPAPNHAAKRQPAGRRLHPLQLPLETRRVRPVAAEGCPTYFEFALNDNEARVARRRSPDLAEIRDCRSQRIRREWARSPKVVRSVRFVGDLRSRQCGVRRPSHSRGHGSAGSGDPHTAERPAHSRGWRRRAKG